MLASILQWTSPAEVNHRKRIILMVCAKDPVYLFKMCGALRSRALPLK